MTNFDSMDLRDEHDRKLVARVRPEAYRNPEPADVYDLVVIGAGTAGLVAAAGAAGLNARVALIERDLMGGDCLNVGCVPSKLMISSARAVTEIKQAAGLGISISGEPKVDFSEVMTRMRRLRSDLSSHDSVERFTELGVDVFLGPGRFVDCTSVEVGGRILRFVKAVICTGSRASVPAIPGLDQVSFDTNETIFSFTELPERLGIVGAGFIGCEMAQTFSRLGSRVSLFASERGVMPMESRDAAEIVIRGLHEDGVRIFTHGRRLEFEADGQGIRVQERNGDAERKETVDRLLIATGRTPNLEGLELEKAEVRYSDQGIVIDDFFRTSNSRIYASGDVCSRHRFTHAVDIMSRSVLANALFKGRKRYSRLVIPRCLYTHPELAHVGVEPGGLDDQGRKFTELTLPLSDMDRAVIDGRTDGFIRVYLKQNSDRILGATIVSDNAKDLIGLFTIAITRQIGLGAFSRMVFPYPSYAEAIRKLADKYQKSRLNPTLHRLIGKWHGLNRYLFKKLNRLGKGSS